MLAAPIAEPNPGSTSSIKIHIAEAETQCWEKLRNEGTDPDQNVTIADLEQMVAQASPLIAQELGLSRANLPPIKFVDPNKPNNYFFNRIGIREPLQLAWTKNAAYHEAVHAQIVAESLYKMPVHLAFGRFTDKFGGPANETFTEVVTYEVLATQALEGDRLAECSFLRGMHWDTSVLMRGEAGETLTGDEQDYQAKPASIVLQALKGNTMYKGVELDSVAKLLSEMFLD